jgi:hypothetical protein
MRSYALLMMIRMLGMAVWQWSLPGLRKCRLVVPWFAILFVEVAGIPSARLAEAGKTNGLIRGSSPNGLDLLSQDDSKLLRHGKFTTKRANPLTFSGFRGDPAHETAEVLKAYRHSYECDLGYWSCLTAAEDKIAELAQLCEVKSAPEGGLFLPDFRPAIADIPHRLHVVWSTRGNLSESTVRDLFNAPSATNQAAEPAISIRAVSHNNQENQNDYE